MPSVALFIDAESLRLSVGSQYLPALRQEDLRASLQAPRAFLKAALDRARAAGTVAHAQATFWAGEAPGAPTGWGAAPLQQALEDLMIENRSVTRRGGAAKNAVDNYLTVDVMNVLQEKNPDVVVIAGADADYHPLYREVFRRRKSLVVAGLARSMAPAVRASLNENGAEIVLLDEALGLTEAAFGRAAAPPVSAPVGTETSYFAMGGGAGGTASRYGAGMDTRRGSRFFRQEEAGAADAIPWKEPPFREGDAVEGTVIRVGRVGAVVEVEGIQGFLHKREMDWKWVEDPTQLVSVGQRVRVKAIRINPQEGVFYGLKQLEPFEVDENFYLNNEVDVDVVKVDQTMALVRMANGYIGSLGQDDLTWTRSVAPLQKYKVGDRIKARVIAIFRDTGWFKFGLKQHRNNPWMDESFLQQYAEGSEVDGRVDRIVELAGPMHAARHDVAIVELESYVEGALWPIGVSDFARTQGMEAVTSITQVLTPGDRIRAKVFKLNPEMKTISLCLTAILPRAGRRS